MKHLTRRSLLALGSTALGSAFALPLAPAQALPIEDFVDVPPGTPFHRETMWPKKNTTTTG